MKLLSSLMTPGGGMICFELSTGTTLALVFYSKDQGREALCQHVAGLSAEEARTVAEDLAAAPMPEAAKTQPLRIEGSAARTLNSMGKFARSSAGGRNAVFSVATARSAVFSLFTADDPRHLDGLLGYVDQKGLHHIAIFYSKEQAQSLVDSLAWLQPDKKKRLSKHVTRCELPRRSRQPRVMISGELAGWLNCAWEYAKQQRTAN